MRLTFCALSILLWTSHASSQEQQPDGSLVDNLNKAIGIEDTTPAPSSGLAKGVLPDWGVVVRDKSSGQPIDVFGEVNYTITNAGVEVPGYEKPSGTYLEVVPQKLYEKYLASVDPKDALDPLFKPITELPKIVVKATDYLANELCAKKGRPSGMSLSLVVNASGSIFFATAGTEAGSEVSWEFQDVCTRYGLEGTGIPFK